MDAVIEFMLGAALVVVLGAMCLLVVVWVWKLVFDEWS